MPQTLRQKGEGAGVENKRAWTSKLEIRLKEKEEKHIPTKTNIAANGEAGGEGAGVDVRVLFSLNLSLAAGDEVDPYTLLAETLKLKYQNSNQYHRTPTSKRHAL